MLYGCVWLKKSVRHSRSNVYVMKLLHLMTSLRIDVDYTLRRK